MADITSRLTAAVLTPQKEDAGAYGICKKFATANGLAANGDRIQLLTFGRNGRITFANVKTSATLGASCTLQLQIDRAGVYTNLTVATSAGAASVASGATIGPVDILAGDILTLLVGGANIAAAANVEVDVVLNHAPAI